MLEITSIKNGLVIDHIEAGLGVKIFKYLKLDKFSNKVALIMNAESEKMGRKDIIKIEECDLNKIDYTVLAIMSPGVTVSEVIDGKVNKIEPELPEKVEGVLECQNSRCITSTEKYVPHSFVLMDRETGLYRCEYCDTTIKLSDI
ncbi:MAG: aspartate carbamoyltransferase regulatory subunit [Clostridium sp.]|nr:aspartate carbamoyltransferase regulatory subunit [Clostridium sp.]